MVSAVEGKNLYCELCVLLACSVRLYLNKHINLKYSTDSCTILHLFTHPYINVFLFP